MSTRILTHSHQSDKTVLHQIQTRRWTPNSLDQLWQRLHDLHELTPELDTAIRARFRQLVGQEVTRAII